jgi:hypothetical protein
VRRDEQVLAAEYQSREVLGVGVRRPVSRANIPGFLSLRLRVR